jgi:hypothetical protein
MKPAEKNCPLKDDDRSSASETTSSSSIQNLLVYLEDVHIFALANLLKRPIIVIALETLKNIEPIRLRGIYLPVLSDPSSCVRDPILIAFHDYHFVPLMFSLDEFNLNKIETLKNNSFEKQKSYFNHDNDDDEDEECLIENSEKFTLFENCDNLNSFDDYLKLKEFHAKRGNKNDTANFVRRSPKFYNILPLQHANFTPMRTHFLKPYERKQEKKYLNTYLNLVELEDHDKNSRGEIIPLNILACYLSKSSDMLKKNGISIYLDYLNDTIKETDTSLISEKQLEQQQQRDHERVFNSPVNRESIDLNIARATTPLTKSATSSRINNRESFCVAEYCTNPAAKSDLCADHLIAKSKEYENKNRSESIENQKTNYLMKCSTPDCPIPLRLTQQPMSTFNPNEKRFCDRCIIDIDSTKNRLNLPGRNLNRSYNNLNTIGITRSAYAESPTFSREIRIPIQIQHYPAKKEEPKSVSRVLHEISPKLKLDNSNQYLSAYNNIEIKDNSSKNDNRFGNTNRRKYGFYDENDSDMPNFNTTNNNRLIQYVKCIGCGKFYDSKIEPQRIKGHCYNCFIGGNF